MADHPLWGESLHPERDGGEHEPSEPGADQLIQAGDRQGEPRLRHRLVLLQGRKQPAEPHRQAVQGADHRLEGDPADEGAVHAEPFQAGVPGDTEPGDEGLV